jgi:hypothetical protein
MVILHSYVSLPEGNLIGGWPTPLKIMQGRWDADIPNIWKKLEK